jgi:hypothetical protein
MANKVKLTVAQIRAKYKELNPLKFGEHANPLVATRTKFIITGVKAQNANGESMVKWVDVTKLSPEAQAANPGLTVTRFMRIMKTDDTPEVVKPGDILRVSRNPIPDNLFERSQPDLFEKLKRLLAEKGPDGKMSHFLPLEPDTAGNPRIKLLSPVMGCFVTLNVPGHYRMNKDGKPLVGSRKDIATGKFGSPEKVVFRTDTFFLLENDLDRMEEIAIGRFQKLIEPLLSEEVIVSMDDTGNIIKKEIKSAATVIDEEGEEPTTTDTNEPQYDSLGDLIVK